jgi:hypothetical protein
MRKRRRGRIARVGHAAHSRAEDKAAALPAYLQTGLAGPLAREPADKTGEAETASLRHIRYLMQLTDYMDASSVTGMDVDELRWLNGMLLSSLKSDFTSCDDNYSILYDRQQLISQELKQRAEKKQLVDNRKTIDSLKLEVETLSPDSVKYSDLESLRDLRDYINTVLKSCFAECDEEYEYLFNKKLLLDKEIALREAQQKEEERQVNLEVVRELVLFLSEDSVKSESRDSLLWYQSLLREAMDNYFTDCGVDYAFYSEKYDLVSKELEWRYVEEIYAKLKSNLLDFKDCWKDELRAELEKHGIRDIDDWALTAIGHFKGLPYYIAHKLYGWDPDKWRKAYAKQGVYPMSVVCDQLGEVTQRMARGIQYGRPGLTGHYRFYQEHDAKFPTPPSSEQDPRFAPGATLFKLTTLSEKDKWDFLMQAEEGYSGLYNNGVPLKSINWARVNKVRRMAFALKRLQRYARYNRRKFFKTLHRLAGKLSGTWKGYALTLLAEATRAKKELSSSRELKGVLQDKLADFANSVLPEMAKILEENFSSDKKIAHEYTVVAVQPSEGKKPPKMVLLDTYGKHGSGTMQTRIRSLAQEQGAMWGYVGEQSTKMRKANSPLLSQLSWPYEKVLVTIRGDYGSYHYDDLWTQQMQSPYPPPPAPIVFEYALRNLETHGAVDVNIEFQGMVKETKKEQAKLATVRKLVKMKDVTKWVRPKWMEKKR